MNKAFFINGGAGRVLCSMPALEKYAETNDDFVIVSESWGELYLSNKVLRDKVFQNVHKGLFEQELKDRKIISPEPYRVNQYFNQKCNLIQAFDIEINELDDVRESGKINLELSKEDQIIGHNVCSEVRQTIKQNKVVVFQPFGQSCKKDGQFIYDSSGRSFEIANVIKIIESLRKNYGVILMSEIQLPGWEGLGIACPQNMDLNKWGGVINAADYFLGCDSVGQHFAHAMNKPATIVTGATYPENISYPENKKFTIIDNGKKGRRYSPIRMTMDIFTDRNNEDLMVLDDTTVKQIVKSVKDKIGVSISTNETIGLKGEGKNSVYDKFGKSKGVDKLPTVPALKDSMKPYTGFKKSKAELTVSTHNTGFKKGKETGAAGFMKPTVPSSNKDSKKKPIDQLLEIEAKTVK